MPAGRLNVFSFGRIVMRRFVEDRCMQIASSLTFTSLLSIVPFVTIALTMIAAFPVFGELTGALQTFILHNMVPASAGVIANYTEQFSAQAAKLTAVGIGFLVVTALMTLLTIESAFNDIWRVKRPRPVVQRVFVYWTLITMGPVLIGASLSLTSWLVGQAVGLVHGLPGAGVAVLTVVPILLTGVALTLLYVAMPNRRIAVRDAVIGGLLAAVVFEGMKRGFAVYLAKVPTYTLVYGAFATLPIFLMWIYLSWLVVVFGAVVVAALPEWRSGAGQSEPVPGSDFFDALQILHILWRAHRAGVSVKLPELLAAVTARIERVERILELLTSAGWVTRTVPAGWVLHRDPTTITVEDVYRLFVFRGEAHRPARAADADLDTLVHELGIRVGEHMRMPLDRLFSGGEHGTAKPSLELAQALSARGA
jgi:membrane protein